MTKTEEQKLIGLVKEAIEYANNGMTPNESLYKVAKDNKLNKEKTRRIAEAYNQARTISHLEEKRGSERNEFFDLMNANAVIESLFEKEQKTPIKAANDKLLKAASSYNPGNWIEKELKAQKLNTKKEPLQKVANDNVNLEKAAKDYKLANERLVQLNSDVSYLTDKVDYLYKEAVNTISSQFGRFNFEDLEQAFIEKYGSNVKPLFDKLYVDTNAEYQHQKRAQPHMRDISNTTLADFRNTSYASMENLVAAASELDKKAKEKAKYKKKAEDNSNLIKAASDSNKKTVSESIFEAITKKQEKQAKSELIEKQSNMFGLTGSTLGYINDRKKEVDKSDAFKQQVNKNIEELADPDTRNKLTQIRIQALLHDLMSNDDVISSYDSEDVLRQFNRIYEVAPTAATKPGVMQDLLRRALINDGLEALELGQAADLDKKTQTTEAIQSGARSSMFKDLSADLSDSGFSGESKLNSFESKYGKD